MPVNVSREVQIAAIVLVILCTALAVILTSLTPLDALIAGILAMLLYVLSYLLHLYGRFTADKLRGKKATKVNLRLLPDPSAYQIKKISFASRLHPHHIDGAIPATLLLLLVVSLLWFFAGRYSPMTGFLLGWGIFVQFSILVSKLVIYLLSALNSRK